MGFGRSNEVDSGIEWHPVVEDKCLEQQLVEYYTQDETYWQQKYRMKWSKEGEWNTKVFHISTIQGRYVLKWNISYI